jgi:hypothetical protein
MDPGERALLAETVRDAVEAAQAKASGPDAVDGALADLGWLEMLDAEPRDAIAIVFTALGAANATATVLDDMLATALGVEPRSDLAVLLPTFAGWDAPGRVVGGRVTAEGLAGPRVAHAAELIPFAGDDAGAATVPVAAADITEVHGIDPDGGLHAVTVGDAEAVSVAADSRALEAALALGRRAVGHQIAGAARAMLELAREHALARVQFGRPISQFQAVRHRLADALVAIEALEAALTAAADEETPITGALAKAVAGRTAATVGAHCQQVLAGVGFTTDHPFHRYLKRTIALSGLLGSTDAIVLDLGRELLATKTVPTLIEL